MKKTPLLAAWLTLSMGLAAGPLRAAAPAHSGIEITPGVGLRGGFDLSAGETSGLRSESDPAGSWGLSVAWYVRSDGWLEVLYDSHRLDFHGNGAAPVEDDFDLQVESLQLGGGYQPRRRGPSPYVTVALGLTRYGPRPGTANGAINPSGSIGGGVKIPMGRRILLRVEARAWGTFSNANIEVSCGPGCSVDLRSSGWGQLGLNGGVAFKI